MIKLNPGVQTGRTPSLNEAAFQSTNLIRWSPGGEGLPEKLGGWSRFYPTAMDSQIFDINAWEDLNANTWLGVGCANSLNAISGGTLYNVTPLATTGNLTTDFTTAAGSATVSIVYTGLGATPMVGGVIDIVTQISVGGIILQGSYVIQTVDTLTSTLTITAATPAISNGNPGSVPVFAGVTTPENFLSVQFNNHGLGVGSTFAVPVLTVMAATTLFGFYTVSQIIDANNFNITVWTPAPGTANMNNDLVRIIYYGNVAANGAPLTGIAGWQTTNWGGYLIGAIDGGGIFSWIPSLTSPPQTPACLIPGAPVISTGVFVSMPAQILVAYGAETLGIQDPLLLRWSTNGNYTVWSAATTNQAGSYRIPKGSKLIGGIQGPLSGLLWTDIDLWAMQYIGGELVFGFNELATGCGLIAKFAAGVIGTTVFWLSQKQFFYLPSGGSVTPLPCPVWDFIFQNLDTTNLGLIRCAANSQFNEIAWFFPSKSGALGRNDMYVKLNTMVGAWDVGTMSRCAWIDQSVFGPPIGADPASLLLFQHETSPDADGAAMTPSFTTGYWAGSDGQDVMFTDFLQPDMKYGYPGFTVSASVQITFNYTDFATDAPVYTDGPYTMSAGGEPFINPRFRGRLTSITVQSSDLGTFWRFGGPRVRSVVDGRL